MSAADQPPHPGLTIRIYTVNPRTLERTSQYARRTLEPAKVPLAVSAWPPCSCPQCGGRPAFIGRRDAPPINPAGPQ